MNPIYSLVAGMIFITFYVSHALVALTYKFIKDEQPKKGVSIFINGMAYFNIGLMVFASLAATGFWYAILSVIFESIFSIGFKNEYQITNIGIMLSITGFYFFSYFLVMYSVVLFSIGSKK